MLKAVLPATQWHTGLNMWPFQTGLQQVHLFWMQVKEKTQGILKIIFPVLKHSCLQDAQQQHNICSFVAMWNL